MKIKYAIRSVAVMCLALAGCTAELDVDRKADNSGREGNDHSGISVRASMGAVESSDHESRGAWTRTALNGFAVEWSEGDAIGVFSSQAEAANEALVAEEAGANTVFTGSMVWGEGAHDFYAYYPYVEGGFSHTAVPVGLPRTQTQIAGGDSGHIGALDFMVATPLTGVDEGAAVVMNFSHVFSLIEFRVVGSGAVSAIGLSVDDGVLSRSGTIDLSQARPASGVPYTWASSATSGNAVELNITAPAAATASMTTTPALWMMVAPGDFSEDEFTFTATVDGEAKTLKSPGIDLERGKKYTFVMDLADTDNVLRLIADEGFLAYCNDMMPEWDTDGDGRLSAAEAAAVKTIDLSGFDRAVTSLDLGAFTGLTTVAAPYMGIEQIDVTHCPVLTDLDVSGNHLTEIDLSANTALYILDVSDNELAGIDITAQESSLRAFDCSLNPGVDNTFFVEGWFDNTDIPTWVWSGTETPSYTQSELWAYTDGEGTVSFVHPVFSDGPRATGIYFSTDYSADFMAGGNAMWLVQAEVADPIDVVILGDGFTDRDPALFDDAAIMATNGFFAREPYASMYEAFNVFALPAVSPNATDTTGATPTTTFNSYFGNRGVSTSVGGNDPKTFEYVHALMSALGCTPAEAEARLDRALIVVLMNTSEWAGTCWMYSPSAKGTDWGNGTSVSYFPREVDNIYDPDPDYWFECMLNHETNGHGFAKLADEYTNNTGTIPAIDVANRNVFYQNYGWYKNVDFTSNPDQVRWAKFIDIPAYVAGEGIGVYEGALYYTKGAYRATSTSPMIDNQGPFNAPQREAIYYRINKLVNGAAWAYDFNDFLTWDQRNLTRAAGGTRGVSEKTRAAAAKMPRQAPPVIVGKSSREVYEQAYGTDDKAGGDVDRRVVRARGTVVKKQL